MAKRRAESEEATLGGDYLPLSVWAQRGFDPVAIEQNCREKEMHPILGMTYKVNIKSEMRRAVETLVREELFSKKAPRGGESKRARLAEASEAAAKPSSGSSNDSDNDGNNDSNDNESKDRRRTKRKGGKKQDKKNTNKKGKNGKKEEKDKSGKKDKKDNEEKGKKEKKDAAKRAEEKRLATEASARANLAKRALAKVATVLAMLSDAMEDPKLEHVPGFAAAPAKKAHKMLATIHSEALAAMKARGIGVELSWTMEDLQETYKEAQERCALVQQLLATARKHTV